MNRLAIGLCTCLACASCAVSEMQLKRIDQDIPSALVREYSDNSSPYVDEGESHFWPLLYIGAEHVAKTEDGFQASTWGTFGVGLISSQRGHATYDAEGRLLEAGATLSLFTGLLSRERGRRVRSGDQMQSGYAWSTLWGVFGTEKEPNGARSVTLLWIPIPISGGDRE